MKTSRCKTANLLTQAERPVIVAVVAQAGPLPPDIQQTLEALQSAPGPLELYVDGADSRRGAHQGPK